MLPSLTCFLLLAGPTTLKVNVDGVEREALVYAPQDRRPHPVVYVWHGHSGNMNITARTARIQELWPDAVVVYPNGLPTKGKTDPEGRYQGWQQQVLDENGRDIKFFDALSKRVNRDFPADPARVFSMGHSNGARFTYILWAKRGDAFSGYGISGSPGVGLLRDLKPASVFFTAGEQDPIVPYAGQKFSIESIKRSFGVDPGKHTDNGYEHHDYTPNGIEIGSYIHPGGHTNPPEGIRLTVDLFKRISESRTRSRP